jgi:hypothetical protein
MKDAGGKLLQSQIIADHVSKHHTILNYQLRQQLSIKKVSSYLVETPLL